MIDVKLYQLEQFCIRWQTKVDTYGDSNLEDIFDKFTSLYIVFNKLYRTLETLLLEKNELASIQGLKFRSRKKNELSDNNAATVFVANYLKDNAENIISELTNEIKIYIDIIENNRFHFDIKSELTIENKNKNDIMVLNDLRQNNPIIKFTGLLTILYRIRCNLFHGTKGFFNEQQKVLNPAINSLTIINSFLLNAIILKDT
jgi:hypothetical protein